VDRAVPGAISRCPEVSGHQWMSGVYGSRLEALSTQDFTGQAFRARADASNFPLFWRFWLKYSGGKVFLECGGLTPLFFGAA